MSGRKGELLRGLARAGTADVVGGPMDLLETALNLGIAGGGYVGHKLGLLDTPPELLSGSVGTSDWFAKGTPLEGSDSFDYKTGRLLGALSPVGWKAAGAVKPQPKGQLNAILVPEFALPKYNIPDRNVVGDPLGRLEGDQPGFPHVALPLLRNWRDTLQMLEKGGGKLGDISPEVSNMPFMGDVNVKREAMRPGLWGYADPNSGTIAIADAVPKSQVVDTLHHEATHFADAFFGSPAWGSWVGRIDGDIDEYMRALTHLRNISPDLAYRQEVLLRQAIEKKYKGDAGEIRARVAGASSGVPAPTTQNLRFLQHGESVGLVPSFTFEGPQGKYFMPVSELGPRGRLRFERPAQIGDPSKVGIKGGPDLGIIPHDHAVGMMRPKGVGREEYFTGPEKARRVSEYIRQQPWFKQVTELVEPSAGEGAFLREFPNARAFDIDPRGPGIKKADFLATPLGYKKGRVFIGNPPFGHKGRLAEEFVNKALAEGDRAAFIMPRTLIKPSNQGGIKGVLEDQQLLPRGGFRLHGKPHEVPTVLQTWGRGEPSLPQTKAPLLPYAEARRTPGALAVVRTGARTGEVVPAEQVKPAQAGQYVFLPPNVEGLDFLKSFAMPPARHTGNRGGINALDLGEILQGRNPFPPLSTLK